MTTNYNFKVSRKSFRLYIMKDLNKESYSDDKKQAFKFLFQHLQVRGCASILISAWSRINQMMITIKVFFLKLII